ncbi:hypothetical protein SOCE836_002240 [Sorangium cellulosum]|uniref:PEGA domain-containing protein n=2 Tax=Polyangiaceae TaxID=49 RepID=A0A4P2QFA4_SORCE|nr:hypothetical protein SOCE836_002240 [Sorangium cellulosum]WCQ87558.1 hypothetical protein NQZ70_00221 [Sorangium sp. Soce836]
MRRGLHLLFALLTLGTSTGLVNPAGAEKRSSTLRRSDRLTVQNYVRRAQKARAAKQWTVAVDAYKAALDAATTAPVSAAESAEIAGELGLCELELHNYRDAAEHLTQSLERRELLPVRHQQRFEAGLTKAAFYVGTLLISVDPPDAAVDIDGKTIDRTARTYKLFVTPGQHMVRGRAPGRTEALHSFTAVAGQEYKISMQLPSAAVSSPKESAPASPKTVIASPATRTQNPGPWASWPGTLRITGMAVATAGVSVGTILIMHAGKLNDDLSARRDRLLSEPASGSSMCWQAPQNSPCGELRRLRDARNLSGRAGVATVIAGGVIGAVTAASFFTDFSFLGFTPARERVHVSPVANGNEIGAQIEGMW